MDITLKKFLKLPQEGKLSFCYEGCPYNKGTHACFFQKELSSEVLNKILLPKCDSKRLCIKVITDFYSLRNMIKSLEIIK